MSDILEGQKICPTYFEIGQTYFKIQGTYFSFAPSGVENPVTKGVPKSVRFCLSLACFTHAAVWATFCYSFGRRKSYLHVLDDDKHFGETKILYYFLIFRSTRVF